LEAKKKAVDAVIAKDASAKATIKAEDDADYAALLALRAKNEAKYLSDKDKAAATAAATAKTAADGKVDTAVLL